MDKAAPEPVYGGAFLSTFSCSVWEKIEKWIGDNSAGLLDMSID